MVTLTANYNPGGNAGGTEIVETWEGCSGYGSYSITSIQGHAFKWNTSDVGIFSGDTNCNGSLSCRFGNTATSFIAMNEDIADGACQVSFYAAKWGSDAQPTLKLQYSTNGGTSWVDAGTCSPNATWQRYIFNLNVTGNVRIKILQTSGKRLNVDDIAITTNPSSSVEATLTIGTIPSIEVMQGNASPAVGVKITSENNSQAITLTVSDNFQVSLDRRTWSNEVTLDPSGETVFLRLVNTDVPGVFGGYMVARAGNVEVTADFEAVVHSTVTLGDVNKDGNVNISDVTMLIDYLLGSVAEDGFDANAADVNQDSSINISDVTSLIDMLLNGTASMMQAKGWDALPAPNGIAITTSGEMLEVYDFDANLVASVRDSGLVELPAGVYVVTSDTESRKVVVK